MGRDSRRLRPCWQGTVPDNMVFTLRPSAHLVPENRSSVFVFEGCDPGSGEETPNTFVVPLDTALSIAIDFFGNERMSDAVRWFEL